MVHPDFVVKRKKNLLTSPWSSQFIPATAGLSQKILAKSIRAALDKLAANYPNGVTRPLIAREQWPAVSTMRGGSLCINPRDLRRSRPAHQQLVRRLAYDEYLSTQLSFITVLRMRMKKFRWQSTQARWPIKQAQSLMPCPIPSPVQPTNIASGEIIADLEKT